MDKRKCDKNGKDCHYQVKLFPMRIGFVPALLLAIFILTSQISAGEAIIQTTTNVNLCCWSLTDTCKQKPLGGIIKIQKQFAGFLPENDYLQKEFLFAVLR